MAKRSCGPIRWMLTGLQTVLAEPIDVGPVQWPGRAGELALVQGGGDHYQGAAGSDQARHRGRRLRPEVGRDRLDGQALQNQVVRSLPLGRQVEQVGHPQVDARIGVAPASLGHRLRDEVEAGGPKAQRREIGGVAAVAATDHQGRPAVALDRARLGPVPDVTVRALPIPGSARAAALRGRVHAGEEGLELSAAARRVLTRPGIPGHPITPPRRPGRPRSRRPARCAAAPRSPRRRGSAP